jgi:hypothetical protein
VLPGTDMEWVVAFIGLTTFHILALHFFHCNTIVYASIASDLLTGQTTRADFAEIGKP